MTRLGPIGASLRRGGEPARPAVEAVRDSGEVLGVVDEPVDHRGGYHGVGADAGRGALRRPVCSRSAAVTQVGQHLPAGWSLAGRCPSCAAASSKVSPSANSRYGLTCATFGDPGLAWAADLRFG